MSAGAAIRSPRARNACLRALGLVTRNEFACFERLPGVRLAALEGRPAAPEPWFGVPGCRPRLVGGPARPAGRAARRGRGSGAPRQGSRGLRWRGSRPRCPAGRLRRRYGGPRWRGGGARPGRRQAAVMGPARPTGATARRARGRASRPRALLSNRRPFLTKTSTGLKEGRALLPPQGALLAAKVRRFRDLAVALAGVDGAPAVETGVHIHAARVHAVGHVARGAESWVLVEGVDAATEGAAGSVVARAVGPWLHARHLRASGRRGRRIRPRAQRTGALSKKWRNGAAR